MPEPREPYPGHPPADVQGGDVDVSTDVQPPAEAPNDKTGALSEGTRDSQPAGGD